MNALELYALAPFGALIRYSDGTPRPPARHTKKVSAWESNNSQGRFMAKESALRYPGATDGFTLEDRSRVWIILQTGFSVTGTKTFEIVERLPAGAILKRSTYAIERGEEKIEKVWANEADYRRSPPPSYDKSPLWIVGADGSFNGWTAAEVAEAVA